MLRPTILTPNCTEAGRLVPNDRLLAEVERGQSAAIPVGCDVCIREAQELWLTLTCPTNVETFPNTSVTIRWKDEHGNVLQGTGDMLLVQIPGIYTCIATFGNNTTVACKPLQHWCCYYYDTPLIQNNNIMISNADIPAVQLMFTRNGLTTTGCNRYYIIYRLSITVCK